MKKNNPGKRATKKDAKATDSRIQETKRPIIVVGVGASSGGLKSLKQLFSKMPTGRGVAFVLVQNPEPARKNKIVKLLKDKTALAVVEATEGTLVLADCIYVIPPDKFLNIAAGRLTLKEPVLCNGLRMPIDHFFCSLAVDQRRRGIGILLSGRGSDGTLGLSEIKAAGGRALVEDPGSAVHPDMPQGAIDAGVIDSILPATGMAEAVMMMAERAIAEISSSFVGSPDIDTNLRAVLDILHAKVGHDFRCYKPSTLVRRIHRRMNLAKVTSLEDYAQFLREHPEEVGLLQKDLFIGVTDFFRQPHAWETLAEKVIAPLVDNTQPGSEMRAWVPGCSTGKEAYSLAMLLTEVVEKSGKKVNVQIFATDSDLAALATARSGIYSKEDMGENVSPERLKRFFARKDGQYQIVKDIREMVVFAPQNITADPPFSRLDLISCRNLLIYLDQQVQRKIIDLFHFSLREGGILFLGTAETVGNREELFEPVSKKWRIYRRIGVGHRVGVEIPVRLTGEPGRAAAKLPPAGPPSRMSLASGAQHMLLDRFAPACVMIDRKLQVLYVHGAVENYLTFPPGELTTRIIDIAREGLRARLRGAIAKCLHSNKSVSVTARVRRGDKSVPVKTVVSPLRYPRDIDGLLLITFEDYLIPVAKTRGKLTREGDTQHLMDELKITREELQSTIEQLEHSNDELKSSNEEVTAANEELQSANEELETSKEELQSLNEELNTINIRLQEKVEELEGVNNDVVNLLSSTNIATVFLDKDLRVKRYTPAITRLLSLIPSDAGRHIGDVLRKFSDDMLLDDSRRVLACLTPLSTEVQADDGRWYIRSITPYRTQDDRIEGVVITFTDVDDLKRAEGALQQLNAKLEERVAEQTGELRTASLYSRSLIEASLDPLVTISPEGRITDVNEATEQVTGRTRREMLGTDFSDYFTDPDAAQIGYRKVFADGQVRDYPLTIRHTTGGTIDVLYNATIYRNEAGDVQGVFAAARDVTARKRAEAALREANETLELRVAERTAELAESEERYRTVADFTYDWEFWMSPQGKFHYVSPSAERIAGRQVGPDVSAEELFRRIVHPEDLERRLEHLQEELAGHGHGEMEFRVQRPDGEIRWVHHVCQPIHDAEGRFLGTRGSNRDITERRRIDETLRETQRRLAVIVDSIADGFYTLDRNWRFTHVNDAALRHMGRTREEIVGHSLFEIFSTVHGSVTEAEYRCAMESGEPAHFEAPSAISDLILEIHAYPGEENLTVLFRDVTERKRMETSLREAHGRAEWLAKFPEENPNPVMRVSNDGNVLYCNPASAELPGWACEVGWQLAGPLRPLLEQAMTNGQQTEQDVELGDRFYSTAVVPFPEEGYANIYGRDITERKQAEDALRESEATLRGILEASKESIWQFSSDGLMLMGNETALLRFGKPAEEVIGKHFNEILPAELAQSRLARLKEAVEYGHPVDFEDERSGISFHHSFYPVTNVDGRVNSIACFSSDITERKRAEEVLHESGERFRILSSTAERLLRADDPQAIVEDLCRDVMVHLDCQAFFNFVVDERAGRLRLNACAGIPEEEARAIEWLDYGVAVCGCVAQGRERIIAEDIFHTPDIRTGLIKSFGIQAYCCHPLMTQDRLIGTLSFGTKTRAHFTPEEVELMRIVTSQVAVAMQRKQGEEALHRFNQELEERVKERTAELRAASLYSRSLIEASLDPLVTISPGGKIMDVNEATERMTGRTRGELIGTDFSYYFTEPDAARAGYRKVLADGQVRDYPLTIRDASGNITDVLYNATVYRNAEGDVQGVFAAARDVTETKRIEAELAKYREHLEDMVKDRTAELEALNKELESFSYSVSHDLRAPLRAIDGYARMIFKKQGDTFDDDTKRKFNDIRSNAKMMGQLIDDLLAFSRLGKKQLSLTQLEMDAVIMDVWKELQIINPERIMKLTVQSMPPGCGDRMLIKQVYFNLISNAVKFTKFQDAARIEVGGYTEGNEHVYYVRDNGTGFDMAYYDKLFGVFQRLHKPDDFEGTGVGLATVQRIIHRHEGRVWAEGKVNEGATFYFSLPVKR